MNDLQIFSNEEFGSIRTVTIDNEPWFVGKDVADALGYAEPRSAVSKKVDDTDRGVAEMETPSGKQIMTIINESGLYTLIFGSRLESAKRFKHWVTSEVLPAIRKTGAYGSDNRKWLAELISKTPKENLVYILELYPEYFGDMKLPGSGKDSVDEWISGRGITLEFIRLCPTVTLYADYSGYCDTVGIAKVGKKKFYREIEERFHSSRRQKADGRRYFK